MIVLNHMNHGCKLNSKLSAPYLAAHMNLKMWEENYCAYYYCLIETKPLVLEKYYQLTSKIKPCFLKIKIY